MHFLANLAIQSFSLQLSNYLNKNEECNMVGKSLVT